MEVFVPLQWLAVLGLLILFIYTVYLIKVGRLSAHLAVSWVMTELFLLAIISFKGSATLITSLVGEKNFYSTALLLIVGWIITLMLDTLTRVSELTPKNRASIQESAILRERVDRLEEKLNSLVKNQSQQIPPENQGEK